MKKRILSGFVAGFMAVCMLVLTSSGVSDISNDLECGEQLEYNKQGRDFEVDETSDNVIIIYYEEIGTHVLFQGDIDYEEAKKCSDLLLGKNGVKSTMTFYSENEKYCNEDMIKEK